MKFIDDIAPHAQKVGKEFNILPSLIIAQACLESAFGKSGLAIKGKNLFGIKGSHNGQSCTMRTAEYKKGSKVPYYINAAFRAYPSYYDSLKDLCKLYKNGVSWDSKKYAKVIGEKNYVTATTHVQEAGYATDPNYASKLCSIIERYELIKYDSKGIVVKKKAAASKSKTVIVKAGDSLSKLAGTNNREKLNAIAKKNGIKDINKIYVGQKIKL